MNQSALKTFAQDARNKLRQLIGARLDYVLTADTAELRQQAAQVNELRTALKNEGRDPLIERVAYTWFNRLAALRFMDANGYHPFGARVITPATANETLPELLQQARAGALDADLRASIANPKTFEDLLAGRIPVDHPEAQVFKLLLVAACNYYHRLMPFLFEKIGDATELLLPDDLLTEHSIVADFRENLTDEDCQNEEVLGWFYQYYISEKKDEVMGRNAAVPKQDIPAVTQLFTPHWIVRYLVENSLGRLWLLNRPQSKLREKMPYYIEEVGSGQWAVGSRQSAVGSGITKYGNQELSRPVGLAESHGPGGSGLSAHHTISEGGVLRSDGSVAPGLGVGSVQHRGGGGAQQPSGIQPLPEHRPRVAAGGGDSTAHRATPELPLGGGPQISSGPGCRGGTPHPGTTPQPGTLTAHCPPPTADFLHITKPEDIRLLDPAGGSGHMLTYAFDLLYAIYEEEGYDAPEIPGLILRHNLYGVDICDRAVALAAFALCMKARAKDNRFFRRVVQPHLISLQEIRFEEGELSAYFKAFGAQPSTLNPQLTKLLYQFEEAKNFGSLIQPCLSEQDIQRVRSEIVNRQSQIQDFEGQLFLRETYAKVLRVLEQAEYLCQRYHVVIANPPYFGPKQMNAGLKEFGRELFSDSKTDLYAMFMERGFRLALPNGYLSMIVMQSWMFLHSFEKLREKVIETKTILSMAHLGARAFATISGEIVTVTAFTCLNAVAPGYAATFHRLLEGNEGEKESAFLQRRNVYKNVFQSSFKQIPGSPISYWIGERLRAAFTNQSLAGATISDGQNKTADNGRFVREQWEVCAGKVGREKKWLPYAKGGSFRRWFGNMESVVDWSDAARRHYRQSSSCRIVPDYLWYRPGITWSRVGTDLRGFRLLPHDSTFDMVGSSVFVKEEKDIPFLLGLLNTPVTQSILELLNPSIDLQVKDVRNVPIPTGIDREAIEKVVAELMTGFRIDWDNFETSWDFRDLPLLRSGLKGATLAASWQNWKAHCDAAIRRMQELETENNRLFIAAYGLQDELKPEVPEDQITLARADARKDMVAFLSYAIGCMFGRYSLGAPGLILADAGATVEKYWEKVGGRQSAVGSQEKDGKQSSLPTAHCAPPTEFHPDEDGILPVLDGDWFTDDILGRVREFLRVTFGDDNLAENIAFIESSLGKVDAKTGKVKPADLRTFLARDFYKEHVRTYKKRPIYWMFSSPEGSFQALIYLHRYTRDTVNVLLNDYVREFIGKLEEKHRQLTAVTLNESARPGDRTKAAKELGKIDKMLKGDFQ